MRADSLSEAAFFDNRISPLPANAPLVTHPRARSARVASNNGAEPHGLCPFGFQGLMHDDATGNIYNRYRTWHPLLGKFIQRDPPSAAPKGQKSQSPGQRPGDRATATGKAM